VLGVVLAGLHCSYSWYSAITTMSSPTTARH